MFKRQYGLYENLDVTFPVSTDVYMQVVKVESFHHESFQHIFL